MRVLLTLSVDACVHAVFGISGINKSGNQIDIDLSDNATTLQT